MSRIKLSITTKIGQLALIRCCTYIKSKHTKVLYEVPSALSNPAFSYMVDPTIMKIREMAQSDWLYLIVFLGV